jgi:transposase
MRIWYPKGKQPEIRVEQKKDAQSFYGVLNVKTGKDHLRIFDRQNSANTVQVLRGLEKVYEGKNVLLIWDGAPSHRGEVKKYLKQKPKKWKLRILYFPAYCPKLNPQERIWKDGKIHASHNSEASFEDKLYKFFTYVTKKTFTNNFISKYLQD